MKGIVGWWPVCLLLIAVSQGLAESSDLRAARRLIADGRREEGVRILGELIQSDPANFDARVVLGTTLAIQGVRSESIEQIAEAVRLRPQSAEAYNQLGTTLSRFLETQNAKSAFEHALQLDPHLAEAHVNLALLLAQANDLEDAGKHVDIALEVQRNSFASAYSHYLRAKIWAAQTQFEKAEGELVQAVRVNPNFAEAWLDLGSARWTLADDKGALQAFQKSIQLNPKDAVGRYRLGAAYLRDGQPRRAVLHLRAALKLGGPDTPTLYNLERALRKAGDLKGAQVVHRQMESDLQANRKISENAPQATNLNTEGTQLEKQGDYQGAARKYRMALDLNPTAGTIRLNYGLSLCRLHQWHEGIAEIEEVLRLEPDNGAAARALYIAKEQAEADSKSTKR
jgi:tetratricopeptide (TPR) repeat protein